MAEQCVNVADTSRICLENRLACSLLGLDSLSPLEGSEPPVASGSKASTSTCYRSCMIKKGRCLGQKQLATIMSHEQVGRNKSRVASGAIVILPMMVLVIKHIDSFLVPGGTVTRCHCLWRKNARAPGVFFRCCFMSSLLED